MSYGNAQNMAGGNVPVLSESPVFELTPAQWWGLSAIT